MGLDGTFRHIQVAGDFGVVTSLEKQIDDLLLPTSQLAEIFVHGLHLTVTQGVPPTPGGNTALALRIRGLPFLLQPRGQIRALPVN